MNTDTSPKPEKRWPGVIRVILFLTVFVLLFLQVDRIFMLKNYREYFLASANEEPGTVDVAFIGSSHVYHSTYCMQLFRDYGIASVNQGISDQRLGLTYATAREVIDRHHPKMLVMDIFMTGKSSVTKAGNAHKTLDNMRNIPLKVETILTQYPSDMWEEFLFPFSVYHNRWEELEKKDFSEPNLLTKGSKEEVTHDFRGERSSASYKPVKKSKKKKPSDETMGYLTKIRDLCADNGVQLVFIVLPYYAGENDQKRYNWIGSWCEKNGIGFYNMLYDMDNIGFSLDEGMRDKGHMNYFGGRISTDALGRFLTENYDLPDRRGDPRYASWEDSLPAYHEYLEKEFKKIGEAFTY